MPVSAVPDPADDREDMSDDIGRFMQLRDQLVAELQQAGALQPGCTALLEEVATALRMAAKLREAAEAELFVRSELSGRSYIHPGVAAADTEIRRAALLLQRVDAMAKRPTTPGEPEEEHDPFAQLDAETELSPDPLEDVRIRREMAENQRQAVKGQRK
jgi:hypothetical protein